ncbi:MAG TPA: M56 family metallopeptidase [Bryobacteraceae bacterium]|jgi:beta-lactamase regulating signal transducer with metallopeptidase domain/predicted  nucleic acid-binding Zn-ribbon protein
MLSLLVESALRSIALALAVWLGLWVIRVRHPRLKSMAWTLVLGAALLMPLAMQWHTIEIATPQRMARAAPVPAGPSVNGASLIIAPDVRDHQTVIDWAALARNTYLAIAILLLTRIVTGLFFTARIWRRARPVRETWASGFNIRETTELTSPATFGACILLPIEWREWDRTKRDAVLAHERAHVTWSDFYVQLASRMHNAIFWFSPLSWWLHKQLVSIAEAASDDAALESADPPVYAEILLYFANRPQRASLSVAMARLATLSRRIERILLRTELPGKAGWARYALVAACITIAAFLAAGCSLQARPSPSEAGFWWQTESHDDVPSGATNTIQLPQGSKGEPYAIVSGDSLTMSGAMQDAEQARALRSKIHGEYVWFLHDGKAFFVTDAATIERAKALFRPQEELGRKQAELGAKQAALGEQQARLGQQQAGVAIRMPDLTRDFEDVQARIRELEKEIPATDLREQEQRIRQLEDELKAQKEKSVSQDQLGEYQRLMGELQSQVGNKEEQRAEVESRISELQGRLGELQSQAGEEQSRLGAQQAALGEQQAKLGAEQAKLGREQQRLSEVASRQMHQLLSESLKNGFAKAVP